MKGNRRRTRERALQTLYQLDLNTRLTVQTALSYFQQHFSLEKEMDPFLERLVLGVVENLKAIDETIRKASEHWRADRMAAVDRNLLRLGVFELDYCDDIPATVTINEMIEIAKSFGSESSPAFVNGILDKIRQSLDRPNKAL